MSEDNIFSELPHVTESVEHEPETVSGVNISLDGRSVFAVGETATEKCRDAVRKFGFATIEEARKHYKTITSQLDCSKGIYYNALNSMDWSKAQPQKGKIPTVGYTRPEIIQNETEPDLDILQGDANASFGFEAKSFDAPPIYENTQPQNVDDVKRDLQPVIDSSLGGIVKNVLRMTTRNAGIGQNVMTSQRERNLGVLMPYLITGVSGKMSLSRDDLIKYASVAYAGDITTELIAEKLERRTYPPQPQETKPKPSNPIIQNTIPEPVPEPKDNDSVFGKKPAYMSKDF